MQNSVATPMRTRHVRQQTTCVCPQETRTSLTISFTLRIADAHCREAFGHHVPNVQILRFERGVDRHGRAHAVGGQHSGLHQAEVPRRLEQMCDSPRFKVTQPRSENQGESESSWYTWTELVFRQACRIHPLQGSDSECVAASFGWRLPRVLRNEAVAPQTPSHAMHAD